jgi:hypothetical protein
MTLELKPIGKRLMTMYPVGAKNYWMEVVAHVPCANPTQETMQYEVRYFCCGTIKTVRHLYLSQRIRENFELCKECQSKRLSAVAKAAWEKRLREQDIKDQQIRAMEEKNRTSESVFKVKTLNDEKVRQQIKKATSTQDARQIAASMSWR